jgi:hypothetical protein
MGMEAPEYQRQIPPDDVSDLAILTEDGYPVVHYRVKGNKTSKTDAVALAWNRLLANRACDGIVSGTREGETGWGFYAVRRAAIQRVEDISGSGEVADAFAAQAGSQSVRTEHYTKRGQPMWDRVAAATEEMRKQLQPMFDAKPAPKMKPGPKAKKKTAAG